MDKIEGPLRRLMDQHPGVSHSVIVRFDRALDDEAVEALGLMPGKPDEALGQLTGDAIRAMAERAEVKTIRSSPEMKTYR